MAFPDRLYDQLAADDATLEALAARGNDAGREHLVRHQFSAAAAEPLQKLEDLGAELGFAMSALEAQEPGADREARFRLDLRDGGTLSPFHIYRESLLMRLLAAVCGAEYKGWEALEK